MKGVINAVSDSNLDELIASLGLREDLANGKIFCHCCGKNLSRDNVGCIYPINNEIRLCCDTLECLQRAVVETTPTRKIIGDKVNES